MAYKSLFVPISQNDLNVYNQNHLVEGSDYYDPRAYVINEDGPTSDPSVQQQPVQGQQPTAQPQQPAQGQQPQQPAQGQQPTAQPQQQPAQGQQPGKCSFGVQNILNNPKWAAFAQDNSIENLRALVQEFETTLKREEQSAGNNGAQQPADPNAAQQPVQGQQPTAQPQQQAAQQQPQQQPTAQNSSYIFKGKRLYENDNDGSDDDDETTSSKNSSKTTSSSSNKDFADTKDVKYDGTYKKEDGGSESDFGWDKMMHDSIFGSGKDPFDEDNDVKYSSEYGKGIEKSDGEKMNYNITPTKPEPFTPEKPSFTSLSNPSALSKTVFTTGKVEIKDAPTVATPAPAAGAGASKTGGSGSSSSKKSQDDGSDDANESFSTNYDAYLLNENHIEDSLMKVIIQEFLNDFGGNFDIAEFNEWISDNYPSVAKDPNAFDEIAANAEKQSYDYDVTANEDDDLDADLEDLHDDDLDYNDLSIDELVDAYLEQYEEEDYDEDDAIDWFESNCDEDEDRMEEFLDCLSDQFIEDDINESFDDEFFANEITLND